MSSRKQRDRSRAQSSRPFQSPSGPPGPAAAEPLEPRQMMSAAPVLRISSPQASVNEGSAYVLSLSASGAGVADIDKWTINWGDGPAQVIPGNPTSATHVYASGDAARSVSATATVDGQAFPAYVQGPGGNPTPTGKPDASYGASGPDDVDGTVLTDVDQVEQIVDSALQPDGKLVVAGVTTDGFTYKSFVVARYNTDGTLDATFADHGILKDVFDQGQGLNVAVLPGGDILVSGTQDEVPVLARYTPEGDRDLTLAPSDGFQAYAPNFFDASGETAPIAGQFSLTKMTVQADGGVLLGGTVRPGDGSSYFAVGRLKPTRDGAGQPTGGFQIDTRFGAGPDVIGTTGVALARFDAGQAGAAEGESVESLVGLDVALDNDGNVLLAGQVTFVGTLTDEEIDFGFPVPYRYTAGIVRFDGRTGQLDTSFGQGGLVQGTSAGDSAAPADLGVDAQGRIVLAGTVNDDPDGASGARVSVYRFLPDGSPDASFGGGDGQIVPDFGSADDAGTAASSLLIQSDGKLVVAGNVLDFDNTQRLAVSRYNADGTTDADFAQGGLFVGVAGGIGTAVRQQADGKLIVSGNTLASDGVNIAGDIFVTRFDAVGGGTLLPSLPVAVRNVAPTVSLTGPSTGLRLESLAFAGAFADPGADAWTVTVNFGDGTAPQSLGGAKSFSAGHVFGATGTYNVTVTVNDGDGGIGSAVVPVTIVVAQLRADPIEPGKTMLVVGGSNGADTLNVEQANGQVTVTAGGQSVGSFSPTGRIRVQAGAGNDVVNVANAVTRLVEIYGGDGNDVLNGGNGGNIIAGGAGIDAITAGSGRDLLVGGRGADLLVGNPGDDILIAGYTSYDADPLALAGIYAEWNRADRTYAQRVATLSGTATSALPYRLRNDGTAATGQTVFDDSANDTVALDILSGGAGTDWYFANVTGGSSAEGAVPDVILGATTGEVRSDIDPT